MAYKQSYREQTYLLPVDLNELIPKDHICYLVESVIDSVDFSEFDVKYSGAGAPAYHPRIPSKIIIQSMIDRTRSSRIMARNTRENVVYIQLAEKTTPDFRTLSDFRKNNGKLLKSIFKTTIRMAKELGSVVLEHISIDGSVIKASANNNYRVSKKELDIIEEYVENELEHGIELDRIEDEQFKESRGYDQLPHCSKEKIKSIIGRYQKQLNKRPERKQEIMDVLGEARKELAEHDLDKVSLTDPQARFMKSKKGNIEFSYNTQISTDNVTGIIIANDVCQDTSDMNQLKTQVNNIEENCGQLKEKTKVSLDNGYHNGENIHYLNERKFDPYIPDQELAQKMNGKQVSRNKYDAKNFEYDDKADMFICPEGKELKYSCSKTKKGKTLRVYRGKNCEDCPSKSQCTKCKIRELAVYPYVKERRDMAEKMKSKEAKKVFSRRKETVELVYGHLKKNSEFRDFLTRSLQTVRNELNIASIAYNIRRLWKIIKQNMKVDIKNLNLQPTRENFWAALC